MVTATPETIFFTKFGVAAKYDIGTDTKNPLIKIADEVVKEIVFGEEKKSKLEFYSPFEVKSIYSHLAKVKDEKSLLKFVHRFGLLGVSEYENTKLKEVSYLPNSYIIHVLDNVDVTYKAADEIREIMINLDNLNRGITINRDIAWDYINFFYPAGHADVLKKASDAKITKAYLILKVHKKLTGVLEAPNFTKSGDAIRGHAYLRLIDAIWHQFYLDLIEYDKFKECPYCHNMHTGQGVFCPAPPNSKRSACENAYNQREHRIREREKRINKIKEGGF